MADPKHLKILEQAIEVWNKWRFENNDKRPKLSTANLHGSPITPKFTEEIDCDAYGANAGSGVEEFLALIGLS
jgi:hypothetical protein